jgi:hypothetical protein
VPPPALSGPPPVPPAGDYNSGVVIDRPLQRGFWDQCREWFSPATHSSSGCCGFLHSDHCFDEGIITPVTNPFFFEDPRALTEVRPLFIYQHAPSNNPVFHGGSSEFFGLQGRVAFSENWSLVINKFGLVSLNPRDDVFNQVGNHTGFAEVWLGPKWTFWRCPETQSVAAAGLTFQLPIGSVNVHQNTGTLGLTPYVTYGQSFGRSSWGNFNFVGEAGYSFAVDSDRAEFFQSSLHLDYDVLRRHHFYPLTELNWFHYTKGGRATDLGFEGVDMVNFGSRDVGKHDFVSLAFGARYKFSEWAQFGGAIEFPLTNQKELQDYRLTFDLIFRY